MLTDGVITSLELGHLDAASPGNTFIYDSAAPNKLSQLGLEHISAARKLFNIV